MTLTVPTAGSPILDTWGAAVANQLNRMHLVALSADQSTDSASLVDVTDLTWPVVAGRYYAGMLFGQYTVSATNQGLQMAWSSTPAGTGMMFLELTGPTAATTWDPYRTAAADTAIGATTCLVTSFREFRLWFRFACSTSGDLQMQFKRGGTSGSTGVTLVAGSGGMILETA